MSTSEVMDSPGIDVGSLHISETTQPVNAETSSVDKVPENEDTLDNCLECTTNNNNKCNTTSHGDSMDCHQGTSLARIKTLPIISSDDFDCSQSSTKTLTERKDVLSKSTDWNSETIKNNTLKTSQETANSLRGIRRNTFQKLSEFFNHPKQMIIVIDLLKHHLSKGLLSPATLVADLLEYASDLTAFTSHLAHLFIQSTFVALVGFKDSRKELIQIVHLVCQPLFADVNLHMFHPVASCQSVISKRTLLEVFLQCGCQGQIMFNKQTRFMDMKLSLEETPLISALRKRDVVATTLLLKYGASTKTKWLTYKHAIEVLLFSPHLVYLEDIDLENLRKCLPLVVSATPYIQWEHLKVILEAGYCPLDHTWSDQLQELVHINSAPTLKHISRHIVRANLGWDIPAAINRLHIPHILKEYLNLEEPL